MYRKAFCFCLALFGVVSGIYDNGIIASQGQYPFIVSIQTKALGEELHVCTGAIINERWVVTSAQCLYNYPETIVAGLIYIDDETDSNKQIVNIEKTIKYPKFDSDGNGHNDIALIKVTEAFQFNDVVQPVKLPETGAQGSGNADIVGYSYNLFHNYHHLVYRPALPIIGIDRCNELIKIFEDSMYHQLYADKDSNICVLDYAYGNNCNGDLGEPLYQNGTLLGLASFWVMPCFEHGAPDVFTNVAYFVEWINQVSDKR
ncbi:trypsin-1 [Diabrotica virgifera virgifera]|uniref:Trypsin-1-like n=1 Tax=Diabrotica virgifera virgifera TaxID=50390 RepID=A0A6P7FXX3_DIAVI|nr:trypsin-1 [Diabrotica virgifera virgifera]